MSVAALIELSQELRRLAIAGTGLAAGDRRVAAVLPALEKSGRTVPVFASIAARTEALLRAPKGEAAAEFLRLVTLVGAVLKTQGRTGIDGELAPLPPSVAQARQIPARAMRELREQLHGGRRETLHDALDSGWFGDVRLAPLALEALQSEYAEIANLASTRMLPAYGPAIVPLLVASLDPSLKRPASRVIETVRRLDPEGAAALARQLLDAEAPRVFDVRTDGVTVSDEATAAALDCIGDTDADRALLADALGAKRKAVRVAGLHRLLALGDADAEARAVAMLGGSATKAREAIDAIPALTGPAMAEPVVARAHELVEALRGDKVAATDANDAVRVLSLLVRSEPDESRFGAAFALFERFDVLRRVSGELRAGTLADLFEYLIGACPPARHKAFSRLMMSFEPGLTTLAAIRRLGPVAALKFLEHAGKAHFREGLKEVFPSDFGELSHPERDLPPPSAWNAEWLDLGLRHGLIDLLDHIWPLDPTRVVAGILRERRLGDFELVVIALIADPGRAAALGKKLSKSVDDYPLFAALCDAIAGGERERTLSLAAEIPTEYGRERLATLRARLADHDYRSST